MPFGWERGKGWRCWHWARGIFGRFGRGFRGARAGGPTKCICPNCGYEIPHVRGRPCSMEICPKCGTRMIGKWE